MQVKSFTNLLHQQKFYSDSLNIGPDNFSSNLDMFLAIGERKTHGKFLSGIQGHSGFNKHPASTYVLNEILVSSILGSVVYCHEEGFPIMLSSLFCQSFLKLLQEVSPLIFGCIHAHFQFDSPHLNKTYPDWPL